MMHLLALKLAMVLQCGGIHSLKKKRETAFNFLKKKKMNVIQTT